MKRASTAAIWLIGIGTCADIHARYAIAEYAGSHQSRRTDSPRTDQSAKERQIGLSGSNRQ